MPMLVTDIHCSDCIQCENANGNERMASFCSVLEGAAGQGSPLRSGLNLQLRSHASPKLPVQECPMCPYSSDSPLRLEEHINRQHFDLTSPSFPPDSPPLRDGVFNCPLCVTSFPNSSDLELHVNIEHKDILRYDASTCDYDYEITAQMFNGDLF